MYGIQCCMCNNVTYPTFEVYPRFTLMINKVFISVTLGVHVCLLMSWREYVQYCCEVYNYVAQWSTS